MPKMPKPDLKALLNAERQSALGAVSSSKLVGQRLRALDYYLGDVSSDMPSIEGRSKAVSTDVQDVIEAQMPSLMEIFTAGDDVVVFNPVGPEDEELAAQETDYVNHVFMTRNEGFVVLYTFIKDALLSKNGFVKVYYERTERAKRETYYQQSDDTYALFLNDGEFEVIEHSITAREDGEQLHDFTIERKEKEGFVRIVNVPPEEFLISRRARSIRDTTYCGHRVFKPRADLIDMGYDKKQVMELTARNRGEGMEEIARNTVEQFNASGDTINRLAELVEITEHYVRCDYFEDGKPVLMRVVTGGNDAEILQRDGVDDVEEVEWVPFASMTPIIMPHRFWGLGVADTVIDIQQIKTALLRSTLDNTYRANNQRFIVSEAGASERTIDDLLENTPGGIIRARTPDAVIPVPNSSIGDFVYPLIEYMDTAREMRTGVSRQASAVQPNALQNQSATQANINYSMTQSRVKLIAKVFAETGVKDLFRLIHSTMRKYADKADTIRLRNKWVTVDPRDWKERKDLTISVGLGSGTKSEQVAHLMMVLQAQKEAIQAPQMGLVTPKNIYNTLGKLVEKIDLKSVEPYFTDPSQNQQQQAEPPPDPKMIEVQGKLQLSQAQAQAEIQMKMAELEMKERIAIRQQDIETQLKREQMQMEAQLQAQGQAMNAQIRTSMANVRMGGDIG